MVACVPPRHAGSATMTPRAMQTWATGKEATMDFGVHIEATDRTIAPQELGPLLEERGFESLFLPEHTHLPVGGASVHPSGPQVHANLRRFLDPFIALATVAAVTTTCD